MADNNQLARIISEAVTTAIRQAGAQNVVAPRLPQNSGNQGRVNAGGNISLPSAFGGTPLPPPAKRRRSHVQQSIRPKIHTKNIVCLLPIKSSSPNVPIPRGESRAKLTEDGLVAKMTFESTWNETQIGAEIYSLFHHLFEDGSGQIFSFQYLSTLPGAKKLCVPRTSTLFQWNAQQVLSICARDTLYVAAEQQPVRSSSHQSIEIFTEKKENEEETNRQACELAAICEQEHATNASQLSLYEQLVIEDDILISDDDDEVETKSEEKRQSSCSLDAVLTELHSTKVDEQARSYINVRRSQLWMDSCRHLTKKKFNPTAVISVRFADSHGGSEGAVDAGGPRREYLRLLVRAANLEAGIFCGPENNRVIFPNASARCKNSYKLVGKILAWSLVHGGPAGNFFSKSLYNAIAYHGSNKLTFVEDIADPELQAKVVAVNNAHSLEELNHKLQDSSITAILEAQGALPYASSLNEKKRIGQSLTQHILLDSVQFIIDEIKEGLATLGVLECIHKYPNQFIDVFCKRPKSDLDAQMVDLLFTPTFDEEGSNKRRMQEQAIVYWRDYLQDCMDGEAQASLSDVLIFATGASSPPALGFETNPGIEFVEGDFPKANTCSGIMYIPLNHKEYEKFKETMDFSILNSPCFGYA